MPIAASQKLFGELFPFPKIQCRYLDAPCGGSVSSDRFFGFLGEEIVQLVVVVAVEM
jgi:hypothetical protein